MNARQGAGPTCCTLEMSITQSNIYTHYSNEDEIMIFTLKQTCLSICIFLVSTAAYSDQLTFTTGDWPPYIYELDGTVDTNRPGFSIEIINAVFAKMGHSITYKTAPFLRQIAETEQGKFVALAGVYQEEAPKLLFPQEPIGMTRNCFYTKLNSSWTYTGLEHLSEIRIVVVGGYTYGEIDSYIEAKNGKVMELTGNEASMMNRLTKLVELDRATAFVQDITVAEHFFKKEGIQGRFKTAGCLDRIASMIGFAPNDPRSEGFVREFDLQITKMRESGELGKILEKYSVSDWKR
jgi:polar amino acid transport system substrate-binding protein